MTGFNAPEMNKTALITGASKRIGKAIALHLAGRGWNLAFHYHISGTDAQQLRAELAELYPNQHFATFRANLELTDEVEALIPMVLERMANIDLLVNNASLFEPSTIRETNAHLFDRQMQVNLRAPFLLTAKFAQLIGKGSIINICDTRIVTNQSSFAAYTLSKKALWELTKMAALELGPEIRVNAIAPGLSLPPEGKDDQYLWKLAENIALKRPGGLDSILKSIDYIQENTYLTGQMLFCDGGENLGMKR
jgi:NAD(P)-dependent dehydrogenase (short-subunit alcohol dehydrogenase family)